MRVRDFCCCCCVLVLTRARPSGGSQYGIRTEDRRNIMTSKENLRKMAAAVIDSKKLRFLSNMVCACDTERVTAEAASKRLVDQLERYGADVLPPLRIGDRPRRKWHGKRGGAHDDLAMVRDALFEIFVPTQKRTGPAAQPARELPVFVAARKVRGRVARRAGQRDGEAGAVLI